MDIETILFVLLTLIGIIVSMYSRYRKAQEAQKHQQENEIGESIDERKHQSVFDDLSDFLGENREEQAPYWEEQDQYAEEYREEYDREAEQQSYEESREVKEKRKKEEAEKEALRVTEEEDIQQIPDEKPTRPPVASKRRGFSARKAIIYSEIINRKHF